MIHINSRCCITYTWSWRTVFGCSCFFSVCIWLIAHSTWSLLSGLLDFTISNLEISLFFHRPYSGSHILLAFCLRVISILLLRFYHLYSAEGASRTHTSSNQQKKKLRLDTKENGHHLKIIVILVHANFPSSRVNQTLREKNIQLPNWK